MKKLIPLIAIILFSCSKSKEDAPPKNAIKITVQAYLSQGYWHIALTSDKIIKSTGTARVKWPVTDFNMTTTYYDREATVNFVFGGNTNSCELIKTDVKGTPNMNSPGGTLLQMSGSGGYIFVNP